MKIYKLTERGKDFLALSQEAIDKAFTIYDIHKLCDAVGDGQHIGLTGYLTHTGKIFQMLDEQLATLHDHRVPEDHIEMDMDNSSFSENETEELVKEALKLRYIREVK